MTTRARASTAVDTRSTGKRLGAGHTTGGKVTGNTGTHQELGSERCACGELRTGSEPHHPSCCWLESHRCFLTQMFIPVTHLLLWVPGVSEARRWWRRDGRRVYGREVEASVRRKNGGHPRKEEGLEFICAYSRVTVEVFRRGLFSFRPLVWEAAVGSDGRGCLPLVT